MDWRTELQTLVKDSTRIRFLEAVAEYAAEEARKAGDTAPPGVLEGQCATAAALHLVNAHLMELDKVIVAAAEREGVPTGPTKEDERRDQEARTRLAEDVASLEAFERFARLLPDPELCRAAEALAREAREVRPEQPSTRSRFELNARRSLPEFRRVILRRVGPLLQKMEALETRVDSLQPGEEWKQPEIMAEHAALLEELQQIEAGFEVDTLLATDQSGGLLNVAEFLRQVRQRVDADEA